VSHIAAAAAIALIWWRNHFAYAVNALRNQAFEADERDPAANA
jgi:hypothetical protein